MSADIAARVPDFGPDLLQLGPLQRPLKQVWRDTPQTLGPRHITGKRQRKLFLPSKKGSKNWWRTRPDATTALQLQGAPIHIRLSSLFLSAMTLRFFCEALLHRLYPVSMKALLHRLSGLHRPLDRRRKVFLLHPFQRSTSSNVSGRSILILMSLTEFLSPGYFLASETNGKEEGFILTMSKMLS